MTNIKELIREVEKLNKCLIHLKDKWGEKQVEGFDYYLKTQVENQLLGIKQTVEAVDKMGLSTSNKDNAKDWQQLKKLLGVK